MNRRLATCAVAVAAALCTVGAGAGNAIAAPPPLWPSNPNWQQYVQAPATRDVHPTAVVSTDGQVTNASALTNPGSGQTATLTRSSSDTGPTDIVLDYGKDVGGLPEFTVTSETGSPTMQAGYSEALQFLTPTGDGGTPFGSGDPSRSDTYTVSGPGTIVNRYVQGGERYEEISLTSPGSVTLSAVEIHYEAYLGTASTFKGTFVSSSDQLNKIWYDGAYTDDLVQMPADTPGGNWLIQNGVLSADGGGDGLLNSGSNWTDYTMSFKTAIDSNQSGWVVRGQSASSNYLLIMNADNDASGTPNELQQIVETNGNYYVVGDASIPFDIKPGSWHTVSTTVSGTTVTTSIDGQRIGSFDTSSLPAGAQAYKSGTIGFREFNGEAARFSDLTVTDPSGAVLYQNPLSQDSDLNDFDVPGTNQLPVILDGAKRDRAVWEGDLSVSGPTLLYTSDATDYLKQSLRLLGSYQLQSGFVEGVQVPSAPVNTSGLLPGTVGSYSATYSMYFVANLADYYLYTGDQSFVAQEWPIVQRELAWNASQVNSQGLFVTDSSDGDNWNLEDHTGAQTYYNALYYRILKDGVLLANAAGHPDLASQYSAQAASLRTAINDNLWDQSLGAYDASTTERGFVTQDANAFAVLYGVAPKADVPTILSTMNSSLDTPFGDQRVSSPTPPNYNQDVSPFIGSYQLWALFAGDDTSPAMDLLRQEWGYMASTDPDSTDWERFQPDGTVNGGGTSWAHGWSTGSVTGLSGYVLGVLPTAPGFSSWLVKPHPGTLAWTEGTVPTPNGTIAVQWGFRTSGSEFAMHVSAPSGTSGTIAVPTYGHSITVDVNGQTVWDGQTGSAYGAHADGGYVYLDKVPGGDYQVDAHPVGAQAQSLSISASPQSLALVAGQSATVTVNVSAQAPNTTGGTITPSLPAGWTASPSQGTFTVDGQAGADPDSVTFKVTAAPDARGGPVTLAFKAAAEGMTSQATVSALPFGSWPSGTTATASSYHSSNTVNGQVRTYVPSNAIDGDLSTFWNDANPATYPAVLTITSPSAVTLPGIAFASFPDGVPVDFTVSTWNGSSWVQQAQITGNDQVDRWIPFNSPVSTTQVQLTVTKDQATTSGEFTRVAELDR